MRNNFYYQSLVSIGKKRFLAIIYCVYAEGINSNRKPLPLGVNLYKRLPPGVKVCFVVDFQGNYIAYCVRANDPIEFYMFFYLGPYMARVICTDAVHKIFAPEVSEKIDFFHRVSNSDNGRPFSATPSPSHCTCPWQASSRHTVGPMPQLVLLPKWLSSHLE